MGGTAAPRIHLVLDVLGGPTEADDGSLWYRVTDGDDTGYMVSDYLSRADSNGGSGEETTTCGCVASQPEAAFAMARIF